ncbi:MAG: PhoH family protein [Actinomycetia bacterium]|nr:PhoH family protein [Actinomycetes bacterium]
MARKKKTNSINKVGVQLKQIEPLTASQEEFFDSWDVNSNHLLLGYPGTGKTFQALHKAFQDLVEGNRQQVIIVRSAVPSRDVGFLPGTLEEKNEVYELPYQQICTDLFGRGDAYGLLKKHGIVRFLTTSYVRGITLDDSVVVVDEFQNMTAHEADSIITRLGKNSKILFCGDFLQSDFVRAKDRNIEKFISVVQDMEDYFHTTKFRVEDIVRSGIVKEYIIKKSESFYEGY